MATFVIGDYEYTTLDGNNVRAKVVDKNKSSYHNIPSTVTYDGVVYNVTNLDNCFYQCTYLIHSPEFPVGATSMRWCFAYCNVLRDTPLIPNSVVDMTDCFNGCTKLTEVGGISSNVVNMDFCFYRCTSLPSVPVIPSTVRNMRYCFGYCSALQGDIYILSNSITGSTSCFNGTTQPITLYVVNSNIGQALVESNTNVTYKNMGTIDCTLLRSQKQSVGKIRVDMVFNCNGVGIISAIAPVGKLYDMSDNELSIPYIFNNGVQCYGIFNADQVPNGRFNIIINGEQSVNIGAPSTATPSQIKQRGQTKPISPQIHCSNVRFNPQTLPANIAKNNVGDFIGQFGYGSASNTMSKVQTNVDGSVKHVITHADNVVIDDSGHTLQSWITAQYNNLT